MLKCCSEYVVFPEPLCPVRLITLSLKLYYDHDNNMSNPDVYYLLCEMLEFACYFVNKFKEEFESVSFKK